MMTGGQEGFLGFRGVSMTIEGKLIYFFFGWGRGYLGYYRLYGDSERE